MASISASNYKAMFNTSQPVFQRFKQNYYSTTTIMWQSKGVVQNLFSLYTKKPPSDSKSLQNFMNCMLEKVFSINLELPRKFYSIFGVWSTKFPEVNFHSSYDEWYTINWKIWSSSSAGEYPIGKCKKTPYFSPLALISFYYINNSTSSIKSV